MKIAIDINKKVGGTRAYGTRFLIQKPSPTTAIASSSSATTSTKTSTSSGPNWKNDKKRKEKTPHSSTQKSGRR
jgi:hypothetical protein